MKRKIDGKMLKDFVDKNFNSYLEFSKKLGISYSHLHLIFNNKIEVGDKTLKKFKVFFNEIDSDFNDFVLPFPIIISGEKVSSIDVFDEMNNLICSVSSRDVVCKDGIKVKCRPY